MDNELEPTNTTCRCYICQGFYRLDVTVEEVREDVCPSCNYVIDECLRDMDKEEDEDEKEI